MNQGTRHLALVHLQRNPAEAAKILQRFPADNVAQVLAGAPAETTAALFAIISPAYASACLSRLESAAQRTVLEACPVPTAAALLRALPEVLQTSILDSVSGQTRRRIEQLLQFPPGTAGGAADPDPLVLHDDITVEQAVDQLRKSGAAIPPVLVVVSRQRHVRGTVTAAQLLGASANLGIGSLELARATTVAQRVPLAALARKERIGEGPVAVLESTGALAGVLDRNVVRTVEKPNTTRRAADLASAFGELYWVGMGRFLGAAIAVSRSLQKRIGADIAEAIH